MERLTTIGRLYVRYILTAISDRDIVEWAIENYRLQDSSDLNNGILEIASLLANSSDTQNAGLLLKSLVDKYCTNFSSEKEAFAIEILYEYCQKLLRKNLSLYEFCKLIEPIEREFDFPEWLGDLYNMCDWIETDQILDEQMAEEVQLRCKELKNLLAKNK